MRTNVHQNSIDSYHELDLTKGQLKVVEALIDLGEATDKQIARHLGYDVYRVTGRITELRDKRLVIECGSVIGEFGKKVRVSRLRRTLKTLFEV